MRTRITVVLFVAAVLAVSLAGVAASKPGNKPVPSDPQITYICHADPNVEVGLRGVKTGMRLTVFTVVGDHGTTTILYPATGTTVVTVHVGETQPDFVEATLEKPARKGGWLYVDDLATNPTACIP